MYPREVAVALSPGFPIQEEKGKPELSPAAAQVAAEETTTLDARLSERSVWFPEFWMEEAGSYAPSRE